jgi:lysophospholipase L1-like esterase
MPTALAPSSTILFIGDSITDCGRFEPQYRPLGNGYVRMFADMLTIREPQKHLRVINRGIGGNAIEDLRSRWHDDVIWHAPEWLSVKIGINDVNHWLCGVKPELRSPKAFGEIYDQVLALTRKKLPSAKMLLIEPFFMSHDRDPDSYRAKVLAALDDYIAVVHKMRAKYDTRLVRTHEIFQRQLDHNHPQAFGDEPVHPNATGHLLIAESVWEALQ